MVKEMKLEEIKIRKVLPFIPLRDTVVFPAMVLPLLIGRQRSINSVEEAMGGDSFIALAFQRDPHQEEPKISDLYPIATFAKILQSLRQPDGSMKILIEGLLRLKVIKVFPERKYFALAAEKVKVRVVKDMQIEALQRAVKEQFEEYNKLNPSLPKEVVGAIVGTEEPERLADSISGYLPLKVKDKSKVLETTEIKERLKVLASILNDEAEILHVQKRIQGQVFKKIEKTQKDFYLQQQMKAIQRELGKEEPSPEILDLKKKIKEAKMSPEAEKKSTEEVKRLSKMMLLSPEATVIRNYLDWMVNLPWSKRTEDNLDIKNAERILNEDHYGLEKPKERILEYLAVRKRTREPKGPILCFVGPPGSGKTSLGKSVARALGREFVRLSLGGIRDEAEIRGHRRTYIGSLPGRIIQSIRKAKVKNPVFLMDEVDKMGVDFRGDPASALLEVLDPEQNFSFSDHYLEVGFDLRDVFFITTANTEANIPPALLDRMETIALSGYTAWEKLEIAKRFLFPKEKKANGLKEEEISIADDAILSIIRYYTREAGVRDLQRALATICRKVTREFVTGLHPHLSPPPSRGRVLESSPPPPSRGRPHLNPSPPSGEGKREGRRVNVTAKDLAKYLGVPKFTYSVSERKEKVGVATGLAWTEYGGDMLFTEVLAMKGKGKLLITGRLGEVMKESAQAALSYVRAHSDQLKIEKDFHKKFDIHIHVPEGAIPKDGPSAGITIAAALVSCLTKRAVRGDTAMTGEITLRGKILPIGGLKSKLLAAQRGEIKRVILPKENEKDLTEITEKVKENLKFIFVENVDDVLKETLI